MAVFRCDARSHNGDPGQASAQFHLLGTVSLEDCLALQRRLAYEAGGSLDGRIVVLLCEHPRGISIGRSGSRGHIELTDRELRARRLPVRWIGRGGGCVLHGPGQIAVYPIVPLRWHGWTVGNYMRRLRQALVATLSDLRIAVQTIPSRFSVWGRTGVLAAAGVAVQGDVAIHGAFINVNPQMIHYPFVHVLPPDAEVLPGGKTTMGCMLAERRQAVRISNVRAALIARIAAALDTQQYQVFTGHRWLPRTKTSSSDWKNRVS